MAVLASLALAAFLPSPVLASDIANVRISVQAHGPDSSAVIVRSGGICESRDLRLHNMMTTVIPCAWNKGTGTISILNDKTKAPICEATLDRDDRWKTFRSYDNSCEAGHVYPKGSFTIVVR
jgi:hypothetical protein